MTIGPRVRMSHDNAIAPTVVIEGDVTLGEGNTIGHYAVLTGPLTVGSGNIIGAHAVLNGPLTIGDGNAIGAHVTLGSEAQLAVERWEVHLRDPNDGHTIRIGNHNVIREYTTIHQPMHGLTLLGDDCYLMAYSHVPHDATLEDGVILTNAVQLGGHAWLGRRANVGLGTVVHQFSSIGAYAMVGMGSVVTHDVPPFVTVAGTPARVLGLNRIGLERNGFTAEDIALLDAMLADLGSENALGVLPERLAAPIRDFLEHSRRTPL